MYSSVSGFIPIIPPVVQQGSASNAHVQTISRKQIFQAYRGLTPAEINPDFIQLSPTIMTPSDFNALDSYYEPVEPKVLDEIDYGAQKDYTIQYAHAFLERAKTQLSKCPTLYDKLFFIMRSGYFRKGTIEQTQFDANKELFRPLIEAHLQMGTPIEFVLPAFPFKFPNPIKVSRRSPDMAEILCLSRLYEICVTIQAIYEPGARFIIISDGQVYQPMFATTLYEALHYRQVIKSMIRRLGYDHKLELVDMYDVVLSKQDLFKPVNDGLRHSFKAWWESNPDNPRRRYLLKTAAANIDLSRSITHDLIQVATHDILLDLDVQSATANLRKIRERIYQRADKAAFEFALFLYTLREIDLVGCCYPRAVRATVHPKPGQWGPHLVNRKSRIFPWQGVAYRENSGEWKIKYEFEAVRRKAVPVHLQGDMFPFYYEASQEEMDE